MRLMKAKPDRGVYISHLEANEDTGFSSAAREQCVSNSRVFRFRAYMTLRAH